VCYSIYLSTTSEEDLSVLPSTLFRFIPATEDYDVEILSLLDHPARWHLECQYGGCSCHFRHLGEGSDLGFAPPADWCPEDDDDIESTKAAYDVIAHILAGGHKLDLVDVWTDAKAAEVTTLDVSLSEVQRDSFRFFENRKFMLSL